MKKEDFRKDLVNLILTNHQINMTSDHSVSSSDSFKSHLNAKRFTLFFNTAAVVQSMVTLLQCLLQGSCERIMVMSI